MGVDECLGIFLNTLPCTQGVSGPLTQVRWIILQRRVRLLSKSIESHLVGKHQRMIVRILAMISKEWTTFQKAKMKDVVFYLEGKS